MRQWAEIRLTRRVLLGGSAGLALTALLAACGAEEAPATTAPAAPAATTAAAPAAPGAAKTAAPVAIKDTIKVGIVTSRSGPLQSYGEQYLDGLELGLDYATQGTGQVKGHKIEFAIKDDAGVPDTAVAAAKDFIGQGMKILAGSVVSGVALQVAPLAEQNQILFISGPAATDGVTGINEYTFRSGRQSYQDILTAKSFLDTPRGKTVLVFAQDTAFGQSNVAAVKAVLGPEGATVDQLLVAQDAKDFAPFAQQIKDRKPDLLFVAWAGTTATPMWTALDGQGVLASTRVVTGLDQRVSYPTFGPAADKLTFLSHYVYQAPQNDANAFLTERLKAKGKTPDLFTPDGFTAAQMIVRAVGEADGADVNKMLRALEGYAFKGPKGDYTIRKEDHALLQPMFQVRLVRQGDAFEPQPVSTLAPDQVAPPVKKS